MQVAWNRTLLSLAVALTGLAACEAEPGTTDHDGGNPSGSDGGSTIEPGQDGGPPGNVDGGDTGRADGGPPSERGPLIPTVSLGLSHACTVLSSHQAYCVGGNRAGQLGIGSETNPVMTPTLVPDIEFHALDAGSVHTCGIDETGQVLCAGFNE